MTLREAAASLYENTLLLVPRHLRAQVAARADILLTAFEEAVLSSTPGTLHAQESAARFYSSTDIAIEVSAFISLGAIDEDSWQSIFAEYGRADDAAPELHAFKQRLTRSLLEIGIFDRIKETPPSSTTMTAGDIYAENVVSGQQFISWSADDQTDNSERLRRAYLLRIVASLRHIVLAGIDPKAASEASGELDLPSIYVDLNVTSARLGRNKVAPVYQGPAPYFVERESRAVILGEPGGGKSTLVNYMCLCLAGQALNDDFINVASMVKYDSSALLNGQYTSELSWSRGDLIPIKIVLRDYSEFCSELPDSPDAGAIWAFIEEQLASAALGDFAPSLRQELLERGGVVFFDGLDEVSEAEGVRKKIVSSVRDFISTFSLCRYVVTSRTHAYRQQGWKIGGFREATIDDLTLDQVDYFVRCWYLEVNARRGLDEDEALGRATILSSAIDKNERLYDLARRPLLLTLMASLHAWRGGSLPEQREELYADAVELLLDTWERQRIRRAPDGQMVQLQPSLLEWLDCDRRGVRALLNSLAFKAQSSTPVQRSETADISEAELITGLTQLSENPNVRPRMLVDYLSQRAGIVVQRAPGIFAFPHRTFQEYLAACHLTDSDYPDKLSGLFAENPSLWREVAQLALAKASRGTPAASLMLAQASCPLDLGSAFADVRNYRGALLAGYALLEASRTGYSGSLHELMRARVIEWLLSAGLSNELGPVERTEASRVLGMLGDPRDEVLNVNSSLWCFVAPGSFVFGSNVPPAYFGHDEKSESHEESDAEDSTLQNLYPKHEAILPYGFWISKYPVTRAQFAEFIQAGGYYEAEYWKEAASLGLWRPGQVCELDVEEWLEDASVNLEEVLGTWRGPVSGATLEEPPNAPVSKVLWTEALAYCRWLNKNFGLACTAQLPSEAEWEKAARGGYDIPRVPIVRTTDALAERLDWAETGETLLNPSPDRGQPWGEASANPPFSISDLRGLASTYAVGLFPQGASPYGVEDMVGHVWELTRSHFRSEAGQPFTSVPYVFDDGRESLDAPASVARTIRAPAAWLSANEVNIAHRIQANVAENFLVGFRVVLLDRRASGSG